MNDLYTCIFFPRIIVTIYFKITGKLCTTFYHVAIAIIIKYIFISNFSYHKIAKYLKIDYYLFKSLLLLYCCGI